MYSFKSRVRYSEINRDGLLDIPAVLNYFQDCSTFQSEQLGVGVDYLKKEKKAWVLSSWQIEFLQDICMLEDIEIGTWSYGAKGIYGYRNFVLNKADGARAVNANTIWVFTDTVTGTPIKPRKEDIDIYGTEPKIEMTDYGRKIMPEGIREAEAEFSVRKYHIDTNGHVNNVKYVQFAMEYLDEVRRVKALRAEYKKSARYGDIIYPVVYKEENALTVSLNVMEASAADIASGSAAGTVYARVQFIY